VLRKGEPRFARFARAISSSLSMRRNSSGADRNGAITAPEMTVEAPEDQCRSGKSQIRHRGE
jgi:hypothetical protein